MFVPSHRVPEPGLSTWQTVDADEPGEHRLGTGLQVQVVAVEGKRARIVCDNGWETRVNADQLVALAAASAPPRLPPPTPPAPLPAVAGGKRRRLTAFVAAAVVVAAGAGLALSLMGDDDGGGGSGSNPTAPHPTENLAAPASIGAYQRAPSGNTESATALAAQAAAAMRGT